VLHRCFRLDLEDVSLRFLQRECIARGCLDLRMLHRNLDYWNRKALAIVWLGVLIVVVGLVPSLAMR